MIKGKELSVSAIENGTVIDHIPSENVFDVIDILQLRDYKSQITFGTHFESKKIGNKGIIKVTDKFFQSEEINKIALFAPEASLIVIKDYNVIEKKNVSLPEEIMGYVKCMNPNCITNHEKVVTKFDVLEEKGNGITLKCHFCEKNTDCNNIEII